MANPTTNYGWQMPTPTDLVTDLPADFEVFGQAADGTVFANAALAVNKTIVDAKGDLIAATAADAVARIAVGANNTVLTADSTAATGMKWAAAAAGGGMTLLQTLTLGTTGVNSSSISADYKHLLILIKDTTATNNLTLAMNFNSDTGSNYQRRGLADAGTDFAITTLFPVGDTGIGIKMASVIELFRYTDTDGVNGTFVNGSGISGPTYRSKQSHFYYRGSSAISTIQFARIQTDQTYNAGTIYIYGVS